MVLSPVDIYIFVVNATRQPDGKQLPVPKHSIFIKPGFSTEPPVRQDIGESAASRQKRWHFSAQTTKIMRDIPLRNLIHPAESRGHLPSGPASKTRAS
jgi:hypothetical protein